MQHGLQSRFARTGDENSLGEIYLTTKRPDDDPDVWEVDAEGLALELDNCQPEDLGETWWCLVGQDIAPNRLRLINQE